jgi:3-keto-disaccharide hydrolase
MPATSIRFGPSCLILSLLAGLTACLAADKNGGVTTPSGWRQHDNHRPKPPVVEPAGGSVANPAPKDAVVLFDGTHLGAWQTPEGRPPGWRVKEGVLEAVPGAGPIQTKDKFGDVQLHVEWAAPNPPHGVGQDRGNSGIFLMGQFEVQVLDSYKAETYADGQAGAIYGQYPPLFNAARAPGEWQTYDIAFRRPRFDKSGQLLQPARVTLIHNGIVVQNNEEPWGPTNWLEPNPYEPGVDRGPIQLQDHSHPVRFRNIWLRNLPDRPAPSAQDLDRPEIVSLPAETLDSLAGRYSSGKEENALRIKLTRDQGHLLLTLPHRPTPLVVEPISATVFVMPRTDARFTFKKDDQGNVTGVVFRVGDAERTLAKIE